MAGGSGIEINRIRHFAQVDSKAFFLPGACTECHKIPSVDTHMMSCSRCRLVWYCGKECQKNNWTCHKGFCKAASSIAAELGGPGSYLLKTSKEAVEQGMDYYEYRTGIASAVMQKLNRRLNPLETKIICSAKVCEICKDANPAILKSCEICYMVFYCSETHENKDSVRHRKFCKDYFLSFQCYQLVAKKGIPLPGAMPFKIPTVKEYKPLSGTTMKDYIKPTFDPAIDACLSEWVSYPLSLIYALEHTGLKDGAKKVNEVKELTILMADAFKCILGTMEHVSTWEYMFHLLPKLKKLNVILCEPNNEFCDGDYKPRDVEVCFDCISRKCELNVTIIKDYRLYKWSEIYKKPDVIFNHLTDNRGETEEFLKYLPFPEPEVPCIFVGPDKNAMETSLIAMKKMEKHDKLLPLKLNPFHGMRPTKVPLDYMEDGGFLQYSNCYIVGLRRNIKGNGTRVRLTPP